MELHELIEKLQEVEKQNGNCLVGMTMIGFSVQTKENPSQEFSVRESFVFPIDQVFAGGPVVIIRAGGEWPIGLAQGNFDKFKVSPV